MDEINQATPELTEEVAPLEEQSVEPIVDEVGEQSPAAEEQPEIPETPELTELEIKARELGWLPPEEFKGKSKPMDADTFIKKRGDELSQLRKQNAELNAGLQEIRRFMSEQQKKELHDVEGRLIDGRYDLEDEEFKKLQKVRDDLVAKVNTTAAITQPITPEIPEEVNEFASRNPWFSENKDMKEEAIAYLNVVEKEFPHATLTTKLRMVEREVKKMYNYNDQPPAKPISKVPYVETSGRTPPINHTPKIKTAKDLSAQERKTGENWVKFGLYSSIDQYAKELFQHKK